MARPIGSGGGEMAQILAMMLELDERRNERQADRDERAAQFRVQEQGRTDARKKEERALLMEEGKAILGKYGAESDEYNLWLSRAFPNFPFRTPKGSKDGSEGTFDPEKDRTVGKKIKEAVKTVFGTDKQFREGALQPHAEAALQAGAGGGFQGQGGFIGEPGTGAGVAAGRGGGAGLLGQLPPVQRLEQDNTPVYDDVFVNRIAQYYGISPQEAVQNIRDTNPTASIQVPEGFGEVLQ